MFLDPHDGRVTRKPVRERDVRTRDVRERREDETRVRERHGRTRDVRERDVRTRASASSSSIGRVACWDPARPGREMADGEVGRGVECTNARMPESQSEERLRREESQREREKKRRGKLDREKNEKQAAYVFSSALRCNGSSRG